MIFFHFFSLIYEIFLEYSNNKIKIHSCWFSKNSNLLWIICSMYFNFKDLCFFFALLQREYLNLPTCLNSIWNWNCIDQNSFSFSLCWKTFTISRSTNFVLYFCWCFSLLDLLNVIHKSLIRQYLSKNPHTKKATEFIIRWAKKLFYIIYNLIRKSINFCTHACFCFHRLSETNCCYLYERL